MSKKANTMAIGIFVILAIIIAVMGAVVLSAGELFKDSHKFVLYFDSDLSGLDEGAPVDYKGVRVGTVKDISIVYDYKDDSISVPVIIEIDRKCFVEINCSNCQSNRTISGMELQTERGLRAQLKTQSLVTGKLKVSLVYSKNSPIVYRNDNPDIKLEEIPTIPGSLDTIAKKISELHLEKIVEDLRTFSKSVAEMSESGKINEILDSLDKLGERIGNLPLESIASDVKTSTQSISEILKSGEMRQTIANLNTLMQGTQELINTIRTQSNPFRKETVILMNELSKTAESIRYLADYLQRHPEALIHGKGKDR